MSRLPSYHARVGHILHVEIERIVKRVTLRVSDRKRALVQHLLRRLLIGEPFRAHKVVSKLDAALSVERRRVDQSIAVEKLIQLLPINLQQARSVAK